MSVACGIVGLPNVGKSTIFSAFTATPADRAIYPFSTTEANVAVVNVPDPRLDWLSAQFKPKKTTPAAIEFLDTPGLMPSERRDNTMKSGCSDDQASSSFW